MRSLLVVAVVSVACQEAAAFSPSTSRSNQRPTRRRNVISRDSPSVHWPSARWGIGGEEPSICFFLNRVTSGFQTRLHAGQQQTPTGTESETKEHEENPTVPAMAVDTDDSLSSAQSSTSSSSIKNWLQYTVLLGLEPTPEILAIVTIYFVEGAIGLAGLAQTYLLKDQLHLGPAEMSALSGLFVLPWTIKPVYGFLSDGLPLFGFKRKSYLIAAGLTGGLSYAVLGWSDFWNSLDTSTAIAGTCAALILSSACIAVSDVVADGIVVTRTRKESADNPALAGSLQSLCWGSSAIGALLASYFAGPLIESLGNRGVFGITATLPLLVAFIALGVDEERVVSDGTSTTADFRNGAQSQAETLWGALQQPAIWRPALFLFIWQATPTSDGAFFYFMTDDLHLGPEFMGRIQLVSAAAGLAGVWLYQQFFRNVNIKDLLFWSTIVSFPLGMLPLLLITHTNQALGIPDTALIYGDDVVLSALGEITFMPTLVLAARLCPPGVEAVLFATLMSSFNGAGTLGTEIGAALTKLMGVTDTNFDNLGLLTVICNVSSLLPLLFIGWMDDASGEDTEGTADAEDTPVLDVRHYGDDVQ
jgi:folate/biopterin transporter